MDRAWLREKLAERYSCAQLMVLAGLKEMGEEDPLLVRAMTGLASGIGGTGNNCGALTGAVCLLGMYAGFDDPAEDSGSWRPMVQELTEWFEERFRSLDCEDITEGRASAIATFCPGLMEECCEKALELLKDYGYLFPEEM